MHLLNVLVQIAGLLETLSAKLAVERLLPVLAVLVHLVRADFRRGESLEVAQLALVAHLLRAYPVAADEMDLHVAAADALAAFWTWNLYFFSVTVAYRVGLVGRLHTSFPRQWYGSWWASRAQQTPDSVNDRPTIWAGCSNIRWACPLLD